MPDNSPSQSDTWVAAARAGDALAVSKLLASIHPALRARVAARLSPAVRGKVEPEDVLQQVYLKVFSRLDRFEGDDLTAFFSWVATIVDHELVDVKRGLHCRKRDVAREVPAVGQSPSASCLNLLDQLFADSVTPSRVVRRDEAVGALLACLAELPDHHREVLHYRFIDGEPVATVAERLGISRDAVVARTRSALGALRKAMDRMGDFTRGS
jgi:RNA polymerase sigma-70 factor (ECF subfamily)